MENVFSNNHNVQLYKQFYKTQNLAVKQVLNSNLSPSDKFSSLLMSMIINQKCSGDFDSLAAFYYDLDCHGIVSGLDINDFVNKDKIDNQIGGKIIYHGKIDKGKGYKLTKIKRIYGKDSHMFLFKVMDLTNHDVKQIGQDMINNITFNKAICLKQPITKTVAKILPCISYKHIDTITTNGTKWYWYLFKVSINYNNKPAFVALLKQQGEKVVQDAINHVNVQYNKGDYGYIIN